MVSTVTEAPTTVSKNAHLGAAKAAKNDEFYTQWADIEREMNAYLEYDPAVFRDKVILLPCDDPEWSNFTKFFALHFADYGIKKLISTSYAPDSNPGRVDYQPTLFESASPAFDKSKTRTRGKKFVLQPRDINGDGVINIDDLQWEYLAGDGDFRSSEVTALRDEADIIITNPPFSLFRPFTTWLFDGQKKFSVIGNMGAVTYNEVFPHIKANRLWYGPSISSGDREFGVPSHYPLDAVGTRVDEHGNKYIRVKGVRWFTNIDHGRRHEPLQLMTAAENIRFSKHKEVRGVGYHRYENFDGIDVPFRDAIPSDYEGIMGVPITFLDEYNPDQFVIIGIGEGQLGAAVGITPLGPEFAGNVGRTKLGIASTKRAVFKRVLIRHKHAS
jgi:hypothetical protein